MRERIKEQIENHLELFTLNDVSGTGSYPVPKFLRNVSGEYTTYESESGKYDFKTDPDNREFEDAQIGEIVDSIFVKTVELIAKFTQPTVTDQKLSGHLSRNVDNILSLTGFNDRTTLIINHLCGAMFNAVGYRSITPIEVEKFVGPSVVLPTHTVWANDEDQSPVTVYTGIIGNTGPDAMAFNKEDIVVEYDISSDSVWFTVGVNMNNVETLRIEIDE